MPVIKGELLTCGDIAARKESQPEMHASSSCVAGSELGAHCVPGNDGAYADEEEAHVRVAGVVVESRNIAVSRAIHVGPQGRSLGWPGNGESSSKSELDEKNTGTPARRADS